MRLDRSLTPPPPFLPWQDSFDIGDERMDGEHRALLDCANDLCLLARAAPPPVILRRLARQMIALVEVHFESEEALFPLIGYRHRQAHVREHLAVLSTLHALLLGDTSPEPVLAAATARLLLLEHILRHDQGFRARILDRPHHDF